MKCLSWLINNSFLSVPTDSAWVRPLWFLGVHPQWSVPELVFVCTLCVYPGSAPLGSVSGFVGVWPLWFRGVHPPFLDLSVCVPLQVLGVHALGSTCMPGFVWVWPLWFLRVHPLGSDPGSLWVWRLWFRGVHPFAWFVCVPLRFLGVHLEVCLVLFECEPYNISECTPWKCDWISLSVTRVVCGSAPHCLICLCDPCDFMLFQDAMGHLVGMLLQWLGATDITTPSSLLSEGKGGTGVVRGVKGWAISDFFEGGVGYLHNPLGDIKGIIIYFENSQKRPLEDN